MVGFGVQNQYAHTSLCVIMLTNADDANNNIIYYCYYYDFFANDLYEYLKQYLLFLRLIVVHWLYNVYKP